MKRERKMLPGDYPQMAFRVSEEKKNELSKLIEQVKDLCNKGRKDNEKVINKNDVIIEALERGLALMKRR